MFGNLADVSLHRGGEGDTAHLATNADLHVEGRLFLGDDAAGAELSTDRFVLPQLFFTDAVTAAGSRRLEDEDDDEDEEARLHARLASRQAASASEGSLQKCIGSNHQA